MKDINEVDHPSRRYRGIDRRRGSSSVTRGEIVAGAVVLAVLASTGIVFSRVHVTLPPSLHVGSVLAATSGAALVVTFVAAGMPYYRYRIGGELRALGVAVGLMVYAFVVVGLGEIAPLVVSDQRLLSDAAGARGVGSMLAVMWWGWASVTPAIDLTNRSRRTVTIGLVGTSVVVLLLGPLPLSAISLGGPANTARSAAVATGVVTVWLLVGARCVWSGLRRTDLTLLWMGLGAIGLASAEVCFATSPATPSANLLAGSIVRMLALAFILHSGAEQFRGSYVDQRSDLFATRVEATSAAARLKTDRALTLERSHEARSALLAIQGAALTLERTFSHTDGDQRSRLLSAISKEIERLQVLVAAERSDAEVRPFDVFDAIESVIECHRATGLNISLECPTGLLALGRSQDLAEVIQNLLSNAGSHAPGAAVFVTARQRDDVVEVRVEDAGSGVPEGEVHRVFDRGWSRSGGEHHGWGLGLFVARRLMQDVGGDLRVERSSYGGAAFIAELSVASHSTASAFALVPSRP